MSDLFRAIAQLNGCEILLSLLHPRSRLRLETVLSFYRDLIPYCLLIPTLNWEFWEKGVFNSIFVALNLSQIYLDFLRIMLQAEGEAIVPFPFTSEAALMTLCFVLYRLLDLL